MTKPPIRGIMLVQQKKGIDTMNCLKCDNYWKTDIDETLCDKCGTQEQPTADPKESEVKSNEPVRPN